MESPFNRLRAAKIIMSIANFGLMRENAKEIPCLCIITAPDLVTYASICLAWTMEKLQHAVIPVLGKEGLGFSCTAGNLSIQTFMVHLKGSLNTRPDNACKHASVACRQGLTFVGRKRGKTNERIENRKKKEKEKK